MNSVQIRLIKWMYLWDLVRLEQTTASVNSNNPLLPPLIVIQEILGSLARGLKQFGSYRMGF